MFPRGRGGGGVNVKYKERESVLPSKHVSAMFFVCIFLIVMNLRNVKINSKISCKNNTGRP